MSAVVSAEVYQRPVRQTHEKAARLPFEVGRLCYLDMKKRVGDVLRKNRCAKKKFRVGYPSFVLSKTMPSTVSAERMVAKEAT